MNKVKYLPLCLFLSAAIKGLITGYILSDGPILLILGCIAAFYEFKSQEKSLQRMHERLNSTEKELIELKKSTEDVKGYFNGMKLGNQMRTNINVK